jgi:hypothetical protein
MTKRLRIKLDSRKPYRCTRPLISRTDKVVWAFLGFTILYFGIHIAASPLFN